MRSQWISYLSLSTERVAARTLSSSPNTSRSRHKCPKPSGSRQPVTHRSRRITQVAVAIQLTFLAGSRAGHVGKWDHPLHRRETFPVTERHPATSDGSSTRRWRPETGHPSIEVKHQNKGPWLRGFHFSEHRTLLRNLGKVPEPPLQPDSIGLGAPGDLQFQAPWGRASLADERSHTCGVRCDDSKPSREKKNRTTRSCKYKKGHLQREVTHAVPAEQF